MSKDIASLPFWKGFHISRWSIQSKTLHLWLRRTDGIQTLCHHCLRPCNSIHDRVERRIRDLPILEYQVVLHVQLLRLACPDCGHRLQAVEWLAPYSRITKRLAQALAEHCTHSSTSRVAMLFGLHWSTVRQIPAPAPPPYGSHKPPPPQASQPQPTVHLLNPPPAPNPTPNPPQPPHPDRAQSPARYARHPPGGAAHGSAFPHPPYAGPR
ncbi:MAG: transposase [Ramlibacter sp.]|nr:transposase [Ramlibacter sp.]